MATFSYTKISQQVAGAFFGFATAEALRQAVRYIGEDCLGDITVSPNFISDLKMGGSAHGGRIYFDGGATKYLEMNTVGTQLSLVGLDGKITSPNILKGDRALLNWINTAGMSTSSWVIGGGVGDRSAPLPYAGSILSWSISAWSTSVTSSGDSTYQIYKNGGTTGTSFTFTFAASGEHETNYTTYARGTHTFAAGDYLNCYRTLASGTHTEIAAVLVEVVFDA